MVNGPRPSKLAAPNGASPNGPSTNGTTPARSPLFLQRQTTSVYSTVTSTGTPVLVYGKAATPLAGAWSAEPWNAEEVAATPMPGTLEDPRGARSAVAAAATNAAADDEDDDTMTHQHDDDTNSSVAETAAYTDAALSVHTRSPVQASAPPMPSSSSCRGPSKHVAFKYRFDPYAASGSARHETYRCDCEDCMDAAATLGSDRLIGGATACYDMTSAGYYNTAGFDRYASSETAAFNDETMSAAGMSWGATADMGAATPSMGGCGGEMPASAFIPPPPPPRIARGIMGESAEDSLDVDAAFYHIAMRWYNKVAAVQDRFVATTDDYCPTPSDETPFDDWVHEAGRWWLRHFEHAQVKSSPSSGLLRTAPVPSGVSRAPEQQSAQPAGFETHTTVSESYSNHRHALRSGPRKTFGVSNLTAGMLAGLGAKPTIPAPRSTSRLDILPW